MRLIDADELTEKMWRSDCSSREKIDDLIRTMPTVLTDEMKPIFDKVLDMMPKLVDAITDALPNIVSSGIKCNECGYFQKSTGKWIQKEDTAYGGDGYNMCSECGWKFSFFAYPLIYEHGFCPHCGIKMKLEDKADD